MTMSLRLAAIVTLALSLGTAAAHAADLRVLSSPATARVLTDLRPRIEGLTHRRLVVKVATSAQGPDKAFDAVIVYEPDAVALLSSHHLIDRMFCIGWMPPNTADGRQDRSPIYAAVSSSTRERDAAQRLVAFLSSFEGLMALTAHGLEGTPNE